MTDVQQTASLARQSLLRQNLGPGYAQGCPLCGSTAADVVSETPYSEIWSNLVAEWGAVISEAVRSDHTPAGRVKLLDCSNCGLHYFSPAVAGSTAFYAELTASCPQYYVDDKWEFRYLSRYLRKSHRVLDVACGRGRFLRSIADHVGVAVGIDTNPEAAKNLTAGNVQILNCSVEHFATCHPAEFDFVSALQVVEHVSDVLPFVNAAYRCVKPGGILAISVPNRARRKDESFGSFDYPPHHMSRWSPRQFSALAEKLGAEVTSVALEPLTTSQTIEALRRDELARLLPPWLPGRTFSLKALSSLMFTFPLSTIWHRLEMTDRMGMHGMSMIAILRKPPRAGLPNAAQVITSCAV